MSNGLQNKADRCSNDAADELRAATAAQPSLLQRADRAIALEDRFAEAADGSRADEVMAAALALAVRCAMQRGDGLEAFMRVAHRCATTSPYVLQ